MRLQRSCTPTFHCAARITLLPGRFTVISRLQHIARGRTDPRFHFMINFRSHILPKACKNLAPLAISLSTCCGIISISGWEEMQGESGLLQSSYHYAVGGLWHAPIDLVIWVESWPGLRLERVLGIATNVDAPFLAVCSTHALSSTCMFLLDIFSS